VAEPSSPRGRQVPVTHVSVSGGPAPPISAVTAVASAAQQATRRGPVGQLPEPLTRTVNGSYIGDRTDLREPVDAMPSHVWGLPSQHQPSLGACRLIQIAGTRRSPEREPPRQKHLFLTRISGKWVIMAIPSSMVSRLRAPDLGLSSVVPR